jgi:polyisoprenoid-binding protein YceI
MKTATWMAAAIGIGMAAGSARAGTQYKVDAAHAYVGFEVSHLVISTVSGKFKEFDATLALDDAGQVAEAKATIKTASIDTGNAKRDDHLRSADFFDAEKNPEITFVRTGVHQEGQIGALKGTLTMHGVSKDIELPFTLRGPVKDPWGATKLGLEASATIDRKDWGLTWNKVLEAGGVAVGEQVKLVINLEFEQVAAKE